ncbi:hypothetical protein [Streptomyces sp. E5N91]|uniref:hypothetical protein n=1 Tax=Streptomyces sp. E5N91 TaxID=1851996 RepID=UPI00187D4E42|nr:hypothetical protein [Streptomyces sp. E5N91]
MPLHQEAVVAHGLLERDTSATERLTTATAALADDLARGAWLPGPLEQSLSSRLLVACAGDGQFTPVRLRETFWEGSVALTYAGGGRLARLLHGLYEVTEHPAADTEPALSAALRLLERIARPGAAEDDARLAAAPGRFPRAGV